MAARALGYGAIGVTPSMSQGDFVMSGLHLSDGDQQAFLKALAGLADLVRDHVPCPSTDAVRARKLGCPPGR